MWLVDAQTNKKTSANLLCFSWMYFLEGKAYLDKFVTISPRKPYLQVIPILWLFWAAEKSSGFVYFILTELSNKMGWGLEMS